MTEEQPTLVTVTGAAGFIGLHCVCELLREGYRVRGTLRSLDRESAIRAALALDHETGARLSFVAANLLRDDGWPAAVDGARYVLHVASPAPAAAPEHEDELIRPARDGTLRVLRAAQAAGVRRVVMTSSIAAIVYCERRGRGELLAENDWSEPELLPSAYAKSKTVAERAAWEFIEGLSRDRPMELVAMNPAYVLGPSLLGLDNASNELIRKLLYREVPGVPNLYLATVDVRDVALAHIAGLRIADAAGKRFILFNEECWYYELAKMLKAAGYNVPTRRLPNWLVRIVGRFDKAVALVVSQLGKSVRLSNEQATTLLDWHPRPLRESALDAAKEIASRM